MHYYQFNIGDYASHTSHLDDMEDLAYRRMIDYCYLNECGLPETIEHIARVIRMRTHSESIANVLREFFYLAEDGTYQQKRINDDISAYREKSEKAKQSARKRWENANANALRTQCEGNANHKPLTKNHKPLTKFKPPTREEVIEQAKEKGYTGFDPDRFINFYESKGWMVGSNKMKSWRAAMANWASNNKTDNKIKEVHL